METRTCRVCGTLKPIGEYYSHPKRSDGLMTLCKECHKANMRERYKPHPRSDTEKRCTRCGELKPISEFYERTNKRSGRWTSQCKPCCNITVKETRQRNPERHRALSAQWARDNPRKVRDIRLRRVYGITIDDYERMLADQNGTCAICDFAPDEKTILHVDHCHDTSEVRGLLCGNCNTGIGQFRHRINLLLSAAKYLQK